MKVQKKMYSVLFIVFIMSCFACNSAPPPAKEKPVEPKPQPVKKVEKVKPVEEPKVVLEDSYVFHFKANSAVMEENDVNKLAAVIEEFKEAADSVEFVIEGHAADLNLPKGERELSVQRVNYISDKLKNNGIASVRIKTVAYGATRPVVPSDTKKNRAKNRRVIIKIVNQ